MCPGRSHLEARFPLRCFQRLSLPNIATRQCHWRDNRSTRHQQVWRQDTTTDNGNWVLDGHGLAITDPVALETAINQLPGVVSISLSARRPADVVIVGGEPPLAL